ncbi:hypothetical protein ACJRO7_033429 [Eucalyptus globulus]|uniref:Uncharacterized protein n=1 Tax=Eucalyptus globulus TaxID=34317 RepID=A0ABD3JTU6_EUCGL
MKRLQRMAKPFIFWVLVSLHTRALSIEIGDGGYRDLFFDARLGSGTCGAKEEKLSIAKIVNGTVSLLRESHNISFRSRDAAYVDDQNKAGKVTVEETAKSAEEVVGKVVHEMVAKVKESMSNENEGEKLKTHNLANPNLSQKNA